ncbi:MAG: hypothetical protein HYY25_06515 [Candidatus Wallbacteria bacterium]|nr:hypothetical protein [Candidatus Wallbacteria bacterium]
MKMQDVAALVGIWVLAASCALAAPELKTPTDVPGYDLVGKPVGQFYSRLAAGDMTGARNCADDFASFVRQHPELAKELQAAYEAARAEHPGLPAATDLAALAQSAADSLYRDSYNAQTPGQDRELTGTEKGALDRLVDEWVQGQRSGDAALMRRAELTAASYSVYFPEVQTSGTAHLRRSPRLSTQSRNQFISGVQTARGGIYDMRKTMREALALWDGGDMKAAVARIEQGLEDFKASGKTAGAGVDWARFALETLKEECSTQSGGGSSGGEPQKGDPDSEQYGGGFTSALSYGYRLDAKSVRYGYAVGGGQPQDVSARLAARNDPAKQKVAAIEDCDRRKREVIDHGSRVASPIVLDMNCDGRAGLYDRNVGPDSEFLPVGSVMFDIDGDGAPERCEWMLPGEDGLLCEDADGDGRIASGRELFGTAGGFPDGYAKLARRDANRDGALTGRELDGLLVWLDDGNALSRPSELVPVTTAGISSIGVRAVDLTSEFTRNGKSYRTWDWYTESVPTARTARR